MKYKVGDKVRIKSLDWYNENKDNNREIKFENGTFTILKSTFLGQIMTIEEITLEKQYILMEDRYKTLWTDEMIEGLVEEETEPKFKVGDEIISDVLQQKWKVIDVERTGYKLLSVNNFDTICGMDFKNEQYFKLVEKEMSLDEASLETDFEYDGLAYTLPDGYIFKDENGNVINATKIVLEKKKKEYPKTYKEYCKVMNYCCNPVAVKIPHKEELIRKFQFLLMYRDAYWKIADDEMGLGKPWEPNWEGEGWYVIVNHRGDIVTDIQWHANAILAFPTAEMRDAFYENFKVEIESCKELL